MKRLFLYYSLSGNGDLVANYLKEKDFDIRKVESKLKLSKNLFLCMMKGGFLALTGSKPKLINYDNNIDDYDEVVIGSPIWNGRFAAPTNTILKETDLEGKKLTFILYAGGGEAPKTVKKINKLYPNSKVITLKQPKKYASELEKIEF